MKKPSSSEARRAIEARVDASADLPRNSIDVPAARSAVRADLELFSGVTDADNRHAAAVAMGTMATNWAAYRAELASQNPSVAKEAQGALQAEEKRQAAKEVRKADELARLGGLAGRDQVVEKIQVVDGGDKLMFSGAQEAKASRRSSAAQETMSEVRARDSAATARGETSIAPPREIRTQETQKAQPDQTHTAKTAPAATKETPYVAGKLEASPARPDPTRTAQAAPAQKAPKHSR